VVGWEVASGRRLSGNALAALRLPPGARVMDRVAAGPDGRLLVAWINPDVRVSSPGAEDPSVPLRGYWEALGVSFAPGGAALALSGRGLLRVGDLASGAERASRRGAAGSVRCLAVSPDGATVAADSPGSDEPGPGFWSVADGNCAEVP